MSLTSLVSCVQTTDFLMIKNTMGNLYCKLLKFKWLMNIHVFKK
jgi:hypothetical protein